MALALTVDLAHGGRITSLRGRGGEWLAPSDGDRPGWDDAVLSDGGRGTRRADGATPPLPVGDGSRVPWSGTEVQHHVALDHLCLRRTITTSRRGAVLRYRLQSSSRVARPLRWATHPRLVLDDEATLDVGVAARWRWDDARMGHVPLPRRFRPARLVSPGASTSLSPLHPVHDVLLRRPDGWGLRLRWDRVDAASLALGIHRRQTLADQVLVVSPTSGSQAAPATSVADRAAGWLAPGEVREWSLIIDEVPPSR